MEYVNLKATFKRVKDQEWECGGNESDQLTSDLSMVDGFLEVFDYEIDEKQENILMFVSFSVDFHHGSYETQWERIHSDLEGFKTLEAIHD